MSTTTEQAAAWFADRAQNTPMPGAREMFKLVAEALREKAERENPQPLTIEELRQMNGEPIHIQGLGWRINHGVNYGIDSWFLNTAEGKFIDMANFNGGIYRHKPKEVE